MTRKSPDHHRYPRFQRSSYIHVQPLFLPCSLRIIATATATYALPPPNFKARLTPRVTYILGVCLPLAWRGGTTTVTASAVMVVSTRRYYMTTILIKTIKLWMEYIIKHIVFFNKRYTILIFSFIIY